MNNTQRGTVTLIVGPMFSGKSTELLRLMQRMTAAKKKFLPITNKSDNRYFGDGEVMGTHDLQSFPAKKVGDLSEITDKEIDEVSTLVIDEGQFFLGISTYMEKWQNRGKDIIIATLNGTSDRQPFPEVSFLYPLATRITHLTAICTVCGKDAPYTKRLVDDKTMILVGGKDSYAAVCENCY